MLGKSFLLTTVFLWAIVNGMKCKAAAPTGIAAANIEIENTEAGAPPLFFVPLYVSLPRVEVGASTLHSLFDLGANYESKSDFTTRREKLLHCFAWQSFSWMKCPHVGGTGASRS